MQNVWPSRSLLKRVALVSATAEERADMTRGECVTGLGRTVVGAPIVVVLVACLCVSPRNVASSWAQGVAPRYEVDVTFPQPFPDLWVTGGFGGHCIDAQDHVLLLNRQDVLDGELNSWPLAPLMIQLDPTGNVALSCGDPHLVDEDVPGLRPC